MTLEISVIIPVYNSAPYISEALESILNQTYRNFEVIIINDGSKDNSGNIIKSFTDNRIRYFENEGNKGLVYSLNRGINESKGKYIARMDADDIALPNRLEKQHSFMEQHPEIGVCGTYAEFLGGRTGIWKYPVSDSEIRCRLIWSSSIIHPSAIIRKDIFTSNKIRYMEEYRDGADYMLWVDISKVSGFHNMPEVLLKYRVHNEQATFTQKAFMDEKKTKIIFGQLISSGVNIKENDFTILMKFITFQYHYMIDELNRIFDIYLEFMRKNNESKKYEPGIINNQIKDRLFEASYFSTGNCGLKALQLYKQHFGFTGIGFRKKLKFYYKGLTKRQ